jgi:hypothetical protein
MKTDKTNNKNTKNRGKNAPIPPKNTPKINFYCG